MTIKFEVHGKQCDQIGRFIELWAKSLSEL